MDSQIDFRSAEGGGPQWRHVGCLSLASVSSHGHGRDRADGSRNPQRKCVGNLRFSSVGGKCDTGCGLDYTLELRCPPRWLLPFVDHSWGLGGS